LKGCIQKKGDFYYAVLAIQNKRKWYKAGPARNDAQRVLAEKIQEINEGSFHEGPKIKFQDFAKSWLADFGINLKPSTLARYKDIIERLLIPAWGSLYLAHLTAAHIHKYIAERMKTVSAKTVSNEVGLIKEMLKHGCEMEYVKNDPSEHVKRPRTERARIEVLSPPEIERLLSKINRKYRLAFLTCVLTGLRAGELWALRWSDIDWNALQITVNQSLWRGQFQTPKSRSSFRKVDIPEQLAHELKKWRLISPQNNLDLIFCTRNGTPVCHDNVVKRYFNPALKRAGLGHVSFHSLRHTNASIRIAAGQNIKYTQHQLGHSSIKITLDTYGHLFVDPEFNRRQVRLLEESLGTARSSEVKTPLLAAGSMQP
jgi:integrase